MNTAIIKYYDIELHGSGSIGDRIRWLEEKVAFYKAQTEALIEECKLKIQKAELQLQFKKDNMEKWNEKVKDAVHDEGNIKGFFGEYRWLSNFEPCLVEWEGLTYSSSEAAYQASKIASPQDRTAFATMTASRAKKEGQSVPIRDRWELIKLETMEKILMSKFSKNIYLREKLLATGDKYLEETNWWHDSYWGVHESKGENNLGILLMKVRDKLRES